MCYNLTARTDLAHNYLCNHRFRKSREASRRCFNQMCAYSPTKSGLRRDLSTGTYYITFKIHGRSISESTGTTSLTLAKETLRRRRNELADLEPTSKDKVNLTLGECLEIYQSRLEARDCSALTKEKYKAVMASTVKTWADGYGRPFESMRPRDVTYDGLLAWRSSFKRSADYANRAVAILSELLEIAREFGAFIKPNPCARIERRPILKRDLIMPSPEQLQKFLEYVQFGSPNAPKQLMGQVRDYLTALAATGLRKSEAAQLTTEHVDLDRSLIHLPASIVKGRRRPRSLPILPEVRPLFRRLVAEADPETKKIFKVGKRLRSLQRACEQAGIPPMTLHHFRHYFATSALESTGNPQLVGNLLGHADGGVLVLKTYGHIRRDFIDQASAKIKILPPPEVGPAEEQAPR